MSSNSSGLTSILEYGIDLKLESVEEETYYISKMCDYFNTESDFRSYLSGDRSFEIEQDINTPLAEIFINDSILGILPYSEDIFGVFTVMLGFIAKYHEEILSDLRIYEVHKIESPDKLNELDDPEEPSSDDDYEWI
jgi:hypothetical protein